MTAIDALISGHLFPHLASGQLSGQGLPQIGKEQSSAQKKNIEVYAALP